MGIFVQKDDSKAFYLKIVKKTGHQEDKYYFCLYQYWSVWI